jgi:hypothetical protein
MQIKWGLKKVLNGVLEQGTKERICAEGDEVTGDWGKLH